MEIEQKVQVPFADYIEQLAKKAGMVVNKTNPDLVVIPFDMGGGRHQNVFVRPMGKTGDGNVIIGFFSPALKMPSGQMLGQKSANDLLRENAKLAHGAWAIEKIENDDYLVVYDTQIAQTMEAEEFKASAYALSSIADEMEKRLGADSF
ncbi:MAG: hypothetical protein HY927_01425 [Elusimicrobia bacterium]|nr:hypothetical protein [Elusimicrobiota bacterium]